MNPNVDRIIKMRECSRVERCHTLPHHGSYTDGQHSHDMVSLYFVLCPDPSLEVVKAIHVHDYGERWCGDVPAPMKWASPELSAALVQVEERCLASLGFETTLTLHEARWLKALDCLELWLWAHDQLAMGNRNAQAIIDNLNNHFLHAVLPDPVLEFLKDYKWNRTSDLIP